MTNDALINMNKIQKHLDEMADNARDNGYPHEVEVIQSIQDNLLDFVEESRAALAPVDVDLMARVYEEERQKYMCRSVYYPNNQAAFKGAMEKALAAQGYIGVPEGYALVPIDLLHKAKVLINFHVKRGACIDINDKLFNEGEIYSELNKLWAQAWAKDAPKKEGV